jgi:hypothetical protein
MIFDATPLKVLENVSALNTTSQEFGINAFERLELGVDFKAGVTAGAVVLEVAPFSGYIGEWAPLITVTFAGTAPKYMRGQAENDALVGRVRVSTLIANGVADAFIQRAMTGRGGQ